MIPIPEMKDMFHPLMTEQERVSTEMTIALWALVERLDAIRYALADQNGGDR